jgi:hypothetical protein
VQQWLLWLFIFKLFKRICDEHIFFWPQEKCSNDYCDFLSSNLPPLVILCYKILLKTLPPHLWFF